MLKDRLKLSAIAWLCFFVKDVLVFIFRFCTHNQLFKKFTWWLQQLFSWAGKSLMFANSEGWDYKLIHVKLLKHMYM